MTTKINILIDGGFFWQRFVTINKKPPTVKDVLDTVTDIMGKIREKTDGETNDILLRVFYYDCKPFGEKIKDISGKEIDYSQTAQFSKKTSYLANLGNQEKFALRMGELSFTGWKQDMYSKKFKPDFKQKSVDMKFGLDMASMATKHIVDKIVLVAGDSDFISPIKYARKEGLLVYIYPMGNYLKPKLREHCDFIL